MLKRLVEKFKKYRRERKDRESDRLKREMCGNAIQSKMCPNFCHNCAWNTGVIKND